MYYWFSKSQPFKPEKDIPSLAGKVILVTGGNTGLGGQAVLEYARHSPEKIWLAARNLEKAEATLKDVREKVPGAPIELLELDLTSFDSVKQAAKTFLSHSDRLDILMLNAGIMAVPPGVTKDGYEIQFGTNHMGHALLTKLLLPALEKTASTPGSDVRVVSLASYGHNMTPKGGIDFDSLKSPSENLSSYALYGQSKLANILFARHLAKVHPEFTTVSLHPGMVGTNLFAGATGSPLILQYLSRLGSCLLSTVADGVKNQLWASVAKDVVSGEYYEPIGVPNNASAHGKDDELAKRLWDWTEKELEGHTI